MIPDPMGFAHLLSPFRSLLLLLLICLWPVAGHALTGTPLLLEAGKEHRLDNGELSWLRDAGRSLELTEVVDRLGRGEFQRIEGNLGVGYTPDVFWLHFALEQADRPAERWIEFIPSYVDEVQLHHRGPDGAWERRISGDHTRQSAKELDYFGTLFKFDLPPGRHDFLLRIQTTSTLAGVIMVWEPAAFNRDLQRRYLGLGLYFGLILTVLIFNLVNFTVSRRPVFVVYVAYLAINSLQWLAINGLVSEFLFPEQPLLANLSLGFSLSLAGMMAYLFFIIVLELRRYHPFIYRLSQLGAMVALLTALATPFGYYPLFAPVMLLIGIGSLILAVAPLWRLWRLGEVWSRLLALAYGTYCALLTVNILSVLALIPFGEWSIHAGMASNICHILVLHFAILFHYRRVEEEKSAAVHASKLASGSGAGATPDR
jgi:two-component system, sensor histidine kinase LadS